MTKETTTIEMTFEQVEALCFLLCFVKDEQKQRYFDTIYGTYNYQGELEGGLYALLDKHRKGAYRRMAEEVVHTVQCSYPAEYIGEEE